MQEGRDEHAAAQAEEQRVFFKERREQADRAQPEQ